MERDLKGLLYIEFVFVDTRGWNIHVDIVRSQKLVSSEEAAIIGVFDSHMKVLHATVKQRLRFLELVRQSEELEWIEAHDAHWAGLGAVRYIPKFFRTRKPSVTAAPTTPAAVNGNTSSDQPTNETLDESSNSNEEKQKSQIQIQVEHHSSEARGNIDHLNAKIVDKLKAIDSAFSLGIEVTTFMSNLLC